MCCRPALTLRNNPTNSGREMPAWKAVPIVAPPARAFSAVRMFLSPTQESQRTRYTQLSSITLRTRFKVLVAKQAVVNQRGASRT